MWRGLQGGYPDPRQKIFEQPETPVKKDHPHVARLTSGQSGSVLSFSFMISRPCHRNAHADPRRDNAEPDPAGMGEVLNRNDRHTLDAKDRDGSMSLVGQKRRLVQWTAAPRLPLYATADQTRAALQYAAMGQKLTSHS